MSCLFALFRMAAAGMLIAILANNSYCLAFQLTRHLIESGDRKRDAMAIADFKDENAAQFDANSVAKQGLIKTVLHPEVRLQRCLHLS